MNANMKLAIGLIVLVACIAVNWRMTKKTIEEGVWLELHGYPRALGAHPLALYLTWLIGIAAIYTNLPFDPPIRAVICLPLFIIGILVQAKLIGHTIEKKVAKSRSVSKETEKVKL